MVSLSAYQARGLHCPTAFLAKPPRGFAGLSLRRLLTISKRLFSPKARQRASKKTKNIAKNAGKKNAQPASRQKLVLNEGLIQTDKSGSMKSFYQSLQKYHRSFWVFLVFGFFSFLLTWISFKRNSQTSLDEIRANLLQISGILATQIDPELHAQITKAEQDGKPLYEKAIGPLRKSHQAAPKIRFVYTLRIKDNKAFFVLDTAARGDNDQDGVEDHSFVMDEYEEPDPAIFDSYHLKKALATKEPYTDQWGTYYSAFTPIFNKNGQVEGILGVDYDLAEFLLTQEKLAKISTAIFIAGCFFSLLIALMFFYFEQKIIKDNEELKKLSDEVAIQKENSLNASRMASLGEMAGGVAHEINNPLAVIKASAELTLDYTKMEQNEKTRLGIEKTQARIIAMSERIAKITKGLLRFARDNKDEEETLYPVHLVIDETLDLAFEKAKSLGVNLGKSDIPQEAMLLCRPVHVSQVLLNLLNNSMDAINQKSEPWIKISTAIENQHFFIRVVDCGNGIDPLVVEKMMNPFFTTKGVGHGTGLGLAISQSIMKDHGGDLVYEFYQGHTSFKMIFPKARLGEDIEVNPVAV